MATRRFSRLLVLRSLAGRRTQSLLVGGSLALAIAVVTTLLCLSIDVERKVTLQLAEFGANVALVPGGDRATFPGSEADKLSVALPPGSVVSPLLYERVEVGTADRATIPTLAVGVDPGTMAKVISFRLQGQPLPESGALAPGRLPILVGGRLAKRMGLAGAPSSAYLTSGGRRTEADVLGVVSTGESEEDQVFVALPGLEALSGLTGRRSAVLVRVPGRPEDVTQAVAALGPRAASVGIEAKLVRRVAATAAAALAKIRGLLTILSVVVVAASLLSAGTVLMEQAIERRGEVGLKRSLGASNREVALGMLAEAAILGLGGGLVGSLIGIGVADLLERLVFGSPLALPALVPAAAVLLGLLLAVLAAALPLRASLAVLPAVALREDRP